MIYYYWLKKELKGEYVTLLIYVQKPIMNNEYMEDYNKNDEKSYLKYWDANNLYGWSMLQKLPVNDFKRVEDISKLDESFIKS